MELARLRVKNIQLEANLIFVWSGESDNDRAIQKLLGPFLSKIEISPQSRRGRGEIIFCLSGDADIQKRFCSIIRRLTIGSIAIKGFDLIREGTELLLQSPSPDWSRKNLPQRSPRPCGETWIRRSRILSKQPNEINWSRNPFQDSWTAMSLDRILRSYSELQTRNS